MEEIQKITFLGVFQVSPGGQPTVGLFGTKLKYSLSPSTTLSVQ